MLTNNRAKALASARDPRAQLEALLGKPKDKPDLTQINVIVRGEKVMEAHHDTVVEQDDHIIMFITDRRQTSAVEKLFQVEVKL